MLPVEIISSQLIKRFPSNHPHTIAVRENIQKSLFEFVDSGLADPKFVNELTSGLDQKFWACVSEALIAVLLKEKNFGKRPNVGKGPDFLLMDGSRKVWIEVVCPEPKNIPLSWLEPAVGEAINFPHQAILLRWTSAIRAKAEALVGSFDGTKKGYLTTGVVNYDDIYVIAVNGCQLRSGPASALFGISQYPFAAEAVFPIGPYQVSINKDTMQVVNTRHQHRPFILNQNSAQVPALLFLDPRFNAVSAIWAIDSNGSSAIGNSEPSAIVHNPNALNNLQIGFLPAEHEYVAIQNGNEFVMTNVSKSHAREKNFSQDS